MSIAGLEMQVELLGRLILALVFGVAGLAKAANLREFREALTEFGVPPRLTAPVAVAIVIVELSCAAGLLWPAMAWRASITALILLVSFTLVLVASLLRGRHPKCRCFGKLKSSPIDWTAVGRNCVLIALSTGVVLAGQQRDSEGFNALRVIGDGMGIGMIQITVLAGGVALAIWLGLQVLRQNGRLLTRLESLEREMATIKSFMGNFASRAGLPIGSRAPSFRLPSMSGEAVTMEDLLASGRSLILMFVDPDCGPCQSFNSDFQRWDRELGEEFTLALLSRGKSSENRGKFSFDERRVLLQNAMEVAELYQCTGTPAAVLISTGGYIRSELGIGTEGAKKLVDLAIGTMQAPTTDGSGSTVRDSEAHMAPIQSGSALRRSSRSLNPE
jgi:peroxiredoxin